MKRPNRRSALASVGLAVSSLTLVACSSSSSNAANSSKTTAPGSKTTLGSSGSDGTSDPADASAPPPSAAAYTPTGPLIADDGFRPEANGFNFQNYGATLEDATQATATNLTPAEMPKLLGNGVCAGGNTSPCTLVPEAQQLMDDWNKGMSGGHCFGFAAASSLMWQGKLNPSDFGADSTPALNIDNNAPLQQELAYAWSFQKLSTVTDAVGQGTPDDIIDKLKQVLVPNPTETYTIGIFMADGSGGHAITPYAIEDAGNGIDKILVYDNNYPGVTREVTVDTSANTWTYDGSTNPSEADEQYKGDATTQSIELFPNSPGLTPAAGDFGTPSPAAGQSAFRQGAKGVFTMDSTTSLDDIWLDGGDTEHAHLLITDAQGRRTGYVNGKLVNEIPGAKIDQTFSDKDWLTSQEPDYYVPDGQQYTITVDGTALKNSDDEEVGVIADYFDLDVSSLSVHPGETDTITLNPDGTKWSFKASQPQTPDIALGISDDTADWAFDIKGDQVPANSEIDLALPDEGGTMTFGTAANAPQSSFTLGVDRMDDKGEAQFSHSGINLSGGDSATLDFGSWTNGQDMQLAVTQGGGSPQDQSLSDQNSN